VIALRGSQTVSDILANANINFVPFGQNLAAFTGYANFQSDIIDGLNDYLTRHTFANKVYFLITGHSLGGATAQLLSASLQSADWITSSNVHTYTIGSPNPIAARTSTGVIGSYNNIFNIVNPGGDNYIDIPLRGASSKFGLILAIPSIPEWGRIDDISAFAEEYNAIMRTDGEQDAIRNIGSHNKESYIAWIRSNPTYGRKVGGGEYSPDSPFR
jgi:hypothetical protein